MFFDYFKINLTSLDKKDLFYYINNILTLAVLCGR